VAFLYANNEQIEKEYRKTIPFTIASKNKKIPRSKLNKGHTEDGKISHAHGLVEST
jgi:hypothetical protein